MELPGTMTCLADQYPRPPLAFQISESEAKSASKTQAKVLIVDDERLLADTTAAILRRAGFNTKTAYEGFAALEVMASFRPELVLTDIMMPGMNGLELAIAITKIYPSTKILLFSGQAGISDILEESKDKGFEFPLLAKPVHPNKLVEGLNSLKND